MNKYQVTINLVVEVEADTEEQAQYDALLSVDHYQNEVVEEDVLDCELLEFRCAECNTELDVEDYTFHDHMPFGGVVCPECDEQEGE